jgi:hypothetical protein
MAFIKFCILPNWFIYVGYHKPCKCLGNIVNVLNLNDEAADLWMKFIIVYMLLGSILILRNYRAKVKTI